MKPKCSKPLLAMALAVSATALLGSVEAAYADETEPTASQIVDKVQDFYAGVDDYKAAFVQTTAHKMFSGRLERGYGTLMFKKGGLMRWEYKRPDEKYFIYDGTFLWIYEPAVPQAFKGAADAERLRRALAFLTGEGKIKDEYKAKKVKSERYGFAKGFVLKLRPKRRTRRSSMLNSTWTRRITTLFVRWWWITTTTETAWISPTSRPTTAWPPDFSSSRLPGAYR